MTGVSHPDLGALGDGEANAAGHKGASVYFQWLSSSLPERAIIMCALWLLARPRETATLPPTYHRVRKLKTVVV